MGARHQPLVGCLHPGAFAGEGDGDVVSGTALLKGCWGQAPGLQYGPKGKSRGAVGLGILPAPRAHTHGLHSCLYHHPSLPAFLPISLACTRASACLPACTPCPYPQLALLPAPLPATRFGVRGGSGARAASRCFRGGGGPCYLLAQRSRNAAVTGANKGRARLGGGQPPAPAGNRPGGIAAGGGARGRVALSPCPGMGVPPQAPQCQGAKATWAAQGGAACWCVLHTRMHARVLSHRLCGSPPWGAAMGHSGLRCSSLHPAGMVPTWAGGRAGRDQAEIKLLMSPSVTRPPITQAGNEEMTEGGVAGGRGAGCQGPQHGGSWGLSPCLNSFPITTRHPPSPQGLPATSCGVGDRGDQGVAGPQPCQEPWETWEGISPFPPLLRPWMKK